MTKITERGIRRTDTGTWLALERTVQGDTVTRERMLDSFAGPGSKARAIQSAGTNRVLDAVRISAPEDEAELQRAADELALDLSGVKSA